MERLEASWKPNKKPKDLQSGNNTKGTKIPAKSSLKPVPNYMKLTESALSKQRKGKPVAKSNGARTRPARVKNNQARESKLKVPTDVAPRTPLQQIQSQNDTRVQPRNVAIEQKHVTPRRKAVRHQKASVIKKPLSPNKQTKREQPSPAGAVFKKRRIGDTTVAGVVGSLKGEVCSGAPDEVTEKSSPDFTVIQKSRKSFAPVNTPFTFSKTVSVSNNSALKFSSSSGTSSLESISETRPQSDEVFAETSSPKRSRKTSTRVQTPGIRRGAVTESPAHATSPLPEGSASDKYSKMHTLRQRLLSQKLQQAVSPEEKLAVLSQSPMIELSRKRRRPTSCENNVVEDVKKDVKDEVKDDVKAEVKDEVKEEAKEKEGEIVVKNVQYFKDLVTNNTHKLETMACSWDEINASLVDVDEAVHGEIRTTSCQARLIIAERFKQFSGLIADCENKTGGKPVLEEDLDGFWDMIYYQVEDVLRKFMKLELLRTAGWKLPEEEVSLSSKPKPLKKKLGKAPKKAKCLSKFAEFKKAMKNKQQPSSELAADPAEDASSCQAKTPVVKTPARKSSRLSTPVASGEVSRTGSNGQAVKTYAFRRRTVENLLDSSLNLPTPGKSVTHKNVLLRSGGPKSARRMSTRVISGIPPLMENSPSLHLAKNENTQMLTRPSASPDLSVYLANVSRDGPEKRKSCSPSASMVRAMLSASKRGKSGRKSLHDQVVAKSVVSDGSPLSTSLFSPTTRLETLHLDETPQKSVAFVDDLVVFTPLPKTPEDTMAPLVTPRRSARIARSKRISLL